MFGHQDDHQDNQQQDDAFVPESTTDAAFTADMQQDGGAPAQDQPAPDVPNPAMPTDTTMFSPQSDTNGSGDTHPDEGTQDAPAFAPYEGGGSDTSEDNSEDENDAPAQAGGDLLDIKTQALQQLSPLVDHLDQSPEEKFRTTMMMIQASDDQSLVKVAYEAAQAITDEKTKAQALLDIVNEINYFTHQSGNEA